MRALLRDQGHEVDVEEGALVFAEGGRRVVLSSPLVAAPTVPAGTTAVSLLLAQRALPSACLRAAGETDARSGQSDLPAGLVEADGGVPVFLADDLVGGLEGAEPRARVDVPGVGDGCFVVRVDTPALERADAQGRLWEGCWVVCEELPDEELDEPAVDQLARREPYLVVRLQGAFQATSRRWSFGLVKRTGGRATGPRVKIQYASPRRTCRPETLPLDQVRLRGRVVKLLGR